MNEVIEERQQAIFTEVGQAVHVAFLIQAQETSGDAPLRKALIRAMESIRLEPRQRVWLDQLKGGGGTVNFAGLKDSEIRAQCAMITEAVKLLPKSEMWVLQAKYGHVEYEDVTDREVNRQQLAAALDRARKEVHQARDRELAAQAALEIARNQYLACKQRITSPDVEKSALERYSAARDDVRDLGGKRHRAESREREAQIALERMSKPSNLDSGRGAVEGAKPVRRFAFSMERIDAIKGLADWFQPMFPRMKPMALDCLLGRIFANHSQLAITLRELEENFKASKNTFSRAHHTMKNHLRQLEVQAFARLEQRFREQGVI